MTSEPVSRSEFDAAMARIDLHFAELESHVRTQFAQQETVIERALATSIRWTVGSGFGLYALTFGIILFVVARELAHP
jgi:hypothetical protein